MASTKGGSISRRKAPAARRGASRSTKPLRLLWRLRKKDKSRQVARGESAAQRAQGGETLERSSPLPQPLRHFAASGHRERPPARDGRMSPVNHDILAVDEPGAVARKKHRRLGDIL